MVGGGDCDTVGPHVLAGARWNTGMKNITDYTSGRPVNQIISRYSKQAWLEGFKILID